MKEIVGDDTYVTGVKVQRNGHDETIPTSGVFIYIGNVPNSKMFANLNITDEQGWILTNDEMGLQFRNFAIGDVRKKKLRQITTAVGDGGIAGQNAYEYLEQLG